MFNTIETFRYIGFLFIINLFISCGENVNIDTNSQLPIDISSNVVNQKNQSERDEMIRFIEENFAKYTSCDSIRINYTENTVMLFEDRQVLPFKITDLQVDTSNFWVFKGNYHNLYHYVTDVISRTNANYSNCSFYDKRSDDPIIRKYVDWNEKHDNHDGYRSTKKNPYEKEFKALFREQFKSEVEENKRLYNKKKVWDFSHNHNPIPSDILTGSKADNYVQLSFSKTLVKFEVYDNVEYDEKYDEKSIELVNECLSYFKKLCDLRKKELSEDNQEKERKRLDSLKQLKRIE